VTRRLVLAAAAALALPGAAHGVATLVSPAPGAVVRTSHPVFTWSVPANEESDAIYVADSPETTPSGEFFSENVVDADGFFGNETSWSPTSPLHAGSYWWLVETHDTDMFDFFYTAPSSFSIPAEISVDRIRVERYTGLRLLDVYVTWRANTDAVTVKVVAFRGRKAVWSKRDTTEFVTPGEPDTTSLYWFVKSKKVRPGTKLRLEVTVTGGGASAHATRRVKAP
jgi:hypothetical protein